MGTSVVWKYSVDIKIHFRAFCRSEHFSFSQDAAKGCRFPSKANSYNSALKPQALQYGKRIVTLGHFDSWNLWKCQFQKSHQWLSFKSKLKEIEQKRLPVSKQADKIFIGLHLHCAATFLHLHCSPILSKFANFKTCWYDRVHFFAESACILKYSNYILQCTAKICESRVQLYTSCAHFCTSAPCPKQQVSKQCWRSSNLNTWFVAHPPRYV